MTTSASDNPRQTPSRRLGTGWPEHPKPFEDDTDRILISGDWHGTVTWGMRVINAARDLGCSTVVIAGDHAILWPGDNATARKLSRHAARAGVRIVAVPGNHDWHPRLDSIPIGKDGFARIEEWIWHAPRPTRWEVEGVRFAALGGAHSVDRAHRIEGESWWADELVTQEHVDALGDEKVDVLITHEAPMDSHLRSSMHLSPRDEAISARQRELIAEAVERTRPKFVFHGHWHQRTSGRYHRRDGGITQVVSLDMQWREGNWVVLDVPSLTFRDPRDVAPATLGLDM